MTACSRAAHVEGGVWPQPSCARSRARPTTWWDARRGKCARQDLVRRCSVAATGSDLDPGALLAPGGVSAIVGMGSCCSRASRAPKAYVRRGRRSATTGLGGQGAPLM